MTTTTATKRRTGSKPKKRTYDGPSPEEKLAADLIALMEKGTAPWRKEWQGHQGEHRNLLTGHEYRGANPLLLELGALMRGHTLPLWLGGAQAKAQGWFPRKGCSAVRITRPQLNKREEEKDDGTTELRQWTSYKLVPVFNAADLVGATEEAQQALDTRIAEALGQIEEPKPAAARLEEAEAVLEAWPVETRFGGVRACYSPLWDVISMPAPEAFTDREAFCATWAHEQTHSTGHEKRLGRNLSGTHGSKSYAREELVAELGAVLICHRLRIGARMENHAAYLKSWCDLLREEPRCLLRVLSDARKAADLIAPEAAAQGAEEVEA